MDKIQKEVEKQLLNNEQEILDKLKQSYAESLADIKKRIKELQSNELTQSKIYQIQYQQNLEKQINGIIDILANGNLNSINDYLAKSYTDGFIGTVYHMQSEGLPFIMPLNQATILKSISKTTEDFKLSTTLYKNAEKLKTQIISEITRGLSQNYTYGKIAQNISGYGEVDFYKSYRIARTEGGRVQTEAKYEAMTQAKENGADVVKQWDSTLDERARTTHAMLDGQIKEIDENFEVDGRQAMYPHGFGIAEEDINCRCALLERARWAVEDEKDFTKMVNGDIVEFANVKDYQDFKQQYFNFYDNGEINKLPNYENAVIAKEKFTQYALNPTVDPNKSIAFEKALGYSMSNADKLIENIYNNLDKFEATEKSDKGYGKRYEVLMTLTGENNKVANVKTAWIVDNKTGETRLTSAYVTSKGWKKGG